MTVKEHYDKHLANFYSWMMGDFQTKSNEFKNFLTENSIKPLSTKIAIDLGSGHGIQSIAIAEVGFQVLAVDFNQQLLDEIKLNSKNLNITILNEDIKRVKKFAKKPELIICCGDTLSHLNNNSEIKTFISDIEKSLENNGKLILSFRDYSTKLKGTERFIHVKSDETKILTCILDYEKDFVNVTDLLHEKVSNTWEQKISTYKKVRLSTNKIVEYIEENGMTINLNQITNRLTTIIASKK